MPEGPNSAYDVGRGLSQAFTSGGPLFPVAFSFIASGGILFVNSDKKYAKSAGRVLSTDSHAGSTPRLGMTELSYERTSSGPNYLLLS